MFQGNDGAANYQRVTIPFSQSLNFTNKPFTVSVWTKHRTARVYYDTAVSHGTSGNCIGFTVGYTNANGNMGFTTYNKSTGDCAAQSQLAANTLQAANTWYHFTGVFNGTHLLVYTNGVLDATPLLAKLPVTTPNQPLYLG